MFVQDDDIPEHLRDLSSYRVLVDESRKIRRNYCRSLFAFFLLGLCNNINFVVLLTAAEDILNENVNMNETENSNATHFLNQRPCSTSSTGVILLANIITATIASLVIPFLPIMIHFRIFITIITNILGYCLIAGSKNSMVTALFGVVFVTIASVLGEATLLQYTAYFHGNVISTWASGTGLAGFIGALSYTLSAEYSYRYTMFGLIGVSLLMGLIFWVLLPVPTELDKQSVLIQRNWNEREVKDPIAVLRRKSHLIPKVLYKYITPLGLVFLFEYFINQGVFQLMKVDDAVVKQTKQYQWLQVAYQIGIFVSKSSVNCIYIRYIWILTCLQLINVTILVFNAIYWFIGNFWIIFSIAIEEGLLGGAAYVNAFVKIGKEEEEEEKQFIISLTCFGNNAGIMIAGFFALLTHTLICKLPPPPDM